MNPTALKAAAKVGFPRTKIMGVWWSGAEEDVIPAGDAAKGYIAAGFNAPGSNFPVLKEIQKYVYAKSQGELEDKLRIGTIGFMQPLKLSCADHEGGGQVKFQQWDGRQWKVISDWVPSDQKLVRPMIEASAAQYAKEKGITPRDRSEEHTSELQSQSNLVCRLLL